MDKSDPTACLAYIAWLHRERWFGADSEFVKAADALLPKIDSDKIVLVSTECDNNPIYEVWTQAVERRKKTAEESKE